MSPNPQQPLRLRAARWLATLAIGAAGGWAASRIGAPLPWMLGALFAVGAAAAAGLRPFGAPVSFPQTARMTFIPVIGVLIGGAVTPELAGQAAGWWPAIPVVVAFVAAAHWLNVVLFTRVGGLDRRTAFFAGMPGGLIESIEMGSRHGADPQALAALQFARIALTVTALPLLFLLLEGEAVGSAAGARIAAGAPLGAGDAALLAAAGVAGFFGARALRLPAGQIIGPMLCSGLVHGLGLTHASPPDWLVTLAQLVVGASLGQRFAGMSGGTLGRRLALSALTVAGMFALGALGALALVALAGGAFAVMLVALAPGGVVEMGLIALSLGADPVFVTFCHVVRILATVFAASAAWRALEKKGWTATSR